MNTEKAPLAAASGASQATVLLSDFHHDIEQSASDDDNRLQLSFMLDDGGGADNDLAADEDEHIGSQDRSQQLHLKPLQRSQHEPAESHAGEVAFCSDGANARERSPAGRSPSPVPCDPHGVNDQVEQVGQQHSSSAGLSSEMCVDDNNSGPAQPAVEPRSAGTGTPSPRPRRRLSSRRRSQVTPFGASKSLLKRKHSGGSSGRGAASAKRGQALGRDCSSLSDLVMAGQLKPGDLLFLVSNVPNKDGSGTLIDEGTLMGDSFVEVSWRRDKLVSVSEWARSFTRKRGGSRYESMDETDLWKRVHAFRRPIVRAGAAATEGGGHQPRARFVRVVEEEIPHYLQLPTLDQLRDNVRYGLDTATEHIETTENQENAKQTGASGDTECPVAAVADAVAAVAADAAAAVGTATAAVATAADETSDAVMSRRNLEESSPSSGLQRDQQQDQQRQQQQRKVQLQEQQQEQQQEQELDHKREESIAKISETVNPIVQPAAGEPTAKPAVLPSSRTCSDEPVNDAGIDVLPAGEKDDMSDDDKTLSLDFGCDDHKVSVGQSQVACSTGISEKNSAVHNHGDHGNDEQMEVVGFPQDFGDLDRPDATATVVAAPHSVFVAAPTSVSASAAAAAGAGAAAVAEEPENLEPDHERVVERNSEKDHGTIGYLADVGVGAQGGPQQTSSGNGPGMDVSDDEVTEIEEIADDASETGEQHTVVPDVVIGSTASDNAAPVIGSTVSDNEAAGDHDDVAAKERVSDGPSSPGNHAAVPVVPESPQHCPVEQRGVTLLSSQTQSTKKRNTNGWVTKVPTKRRQQQSVISDFSRPKIESVCIDKNDDGRSNSSGQPQPAFVPSDGYVALPPVVPRQQPRKRAMTSHARATTDVASNTGRGWLNQSRLRNAVDRKPSRKEVERITSEESDRGKDHAAKTPLSVSGSGAGQRFTMTGMFRNHQRGSGALGASGSDNTSAFDSNGRSAVMLSSGAGAFGSGNELLNPWKIASGGKTASPPDVENLTDVTSVAANAATGGGGNAGAAVATGGFFVNRHSLGLVDQQAPGGLVARLEGRACDNVRIPETQVDDAMLNAHDELIGEQVEEREEREGEEGEEGLTPRGQEEAAAVERAARDHEETSVAADHVTIDASISDDASVDADATTVAGDGEFFPSQPPSPFAPSPVATRQVPAASVPLNRDESVKALETSERSAISVVDASSRRGPVIMGSGLSSDDLREIRHLCRKVIGRGRLWVGYEQWHRDVTHLVVLADEPSDSDDEDGGPRAPRSIKYLCALLTCKRIVSRTWVKASLAAREWADEVPHLCQGDRYLAPNVFVDVQKRVRKLFDRASGRSALFANIRVFVIDRTGGDDQSDLKIVQVEPSRHTGRSPTAGMDKKAVRVAGLALMPPRDHLELLARVGGARVLNGDEPPLAPKTVNEIRAAERCPLVILADNNSLSRAEAHDLYLSCGVRPVSYVWLIESAAQAELLPQKDYYLVQLTGAMDSSEEGEDQACSDDTDRFLQTQHSQEY